MGSISWWSVFPKKKMSQNYMFLGMAREFWRSHLHNVSSIFSRWICAIQCRMVKVSPPCFASWSNTSLDRHEKPRHLSKALGVRPPHFRLTKRERHHRYPSSHSTNADASQTKVWETITPAVKQQSGHFQGQAVLVSNKIDAADAKLILEQDVLYDISHRMVCNVTYAWKCL